MPAPVTISGPRFDDARNHPASAIVFEQRETMVKELEDWDDNCGGPDVWLDFANVEIVNSAELSALIRFCLRLRQLGKSIRACHVCEHLEELFGVTRFAEKV
jgi:anti-anti-sigma regulatory factor